MRKTAAAALMLWAAGVQGAPLTGPVAVDVVSVYDGDTFTGRAEIWPGHFVETAVRVRGVDAPEIRGRCPAERETAQRARQFTAEFLAAGLVSLRNVTNDKYAGRVDADVGNAAGADLAAALIAAGLARAYDGGARAGWCDTQ